MCGGRTQASGQSAVSLSSRRIAVARRFGGNGVVRFSQPVEFVDADDDFNLAVRSGDLQRIRKIAIINAPSSEAGAWATPPASNM